VVARDFLLDERPDLIIDVIDSSNLERNLYLCLQIQELGIPVIGALNMSDEAEAKGVSIDAKALSEILGIPFHKTVGSKGSGVDGLLDLAEELADGIAPQKRSIRYGEEVESRLLPLERALASDVAFAEAYPPRWFAVKLLEKDANAFERLGAHPRAGEIVAMAREGAAWLEGHYKRDAEIVISEQRYGYIRGAVKEAVLIRRKPDFSMTEAVDKVIMNRFLALPIFALVLWGVFQLTFTLGKYPMAWLEALFSWLQGAAASIIPQGFVRSLIVDGIIAGVGGVLSFVPLIVILFLLLSILEDLGYMSRAAFASDKLLHAFGLHGQSIFPMMLGFGCSVPAIMAARTLKNQRDRIVTIMIIPFMSCGAKLPVHVLLAAAFFPKHAGTAVMGIYAIGVALSLVSALVLKRTLLRGDPTPFVMELPPYRIPTLRGILWHVWEKTSHYAKKAGTVILGASVLIWAVTSFPAYVPQGAERDAMRSAIAAERPGLPEAELQAALDSKIAQRALEVSLAGRIGRFIEPAVRPLGFDWRVGLASLTGFAAKEVVVSTLGVLYGVGGEDEEGGASLREALRADPGFTPLTAFVLMLVTLVIPPCFATLATIRSELGWKWLGISFAFLLGLGWILGFIVFQSGRLMGLG
jgi:ferrous iron transport protein B